MYYLYPFLLCLFPIHTIFVENIVEVGFKNYILSCLFMWLIVFLGVSSFNLIEPNLLVAEFSFVVTFFLILNANNVFISLFSSYKRSLVRTKINYIICFLFITFLSILLILYVIPEIFMTILAKVLVYISLLVTLFVGLDIIKRFNSLNKVKTNNSVNYSTFDKSGSKVFPDIYHIVLDAHAGFSCEGQCDKYFKKELENRGFYIYEKARSNYNFTHCSLASCLNMRYIQDMVQPVNEKYSRAVIWSHWGNNLVFRFLKDKGYEVFVTSPKEFIHIFANSVTTFNLSSIYNTLLFSSIFSILKHSYDVSLRSRIFKPFKNFIKICKKKRNAPKYSYLHVLAPHLPYLVTEDGKKIKGEDSLKSENYFTYQKYINKEVLKLIDEIKVNMKENSIILIHGDHSFDKKQKYNHDILLAASFPKDYNSNCLRQNQTLVNLFRCLFNEVFESDFIELDERIYNLDYNTDKILPVN